MGKRLNLRGLSGFMDWFARVDMGVEIAKAN